MSMTIYHLPNCAVAKEDYKKSRSENSLWSESLNNRGKSWHGEPIWTDSWTSPSWVHGELGNNRVAMAEPSPPTAQNDTCIASPRISTGELRVGVPNTEPSHGAPLPVQIGTFLASLRACTRDKDLVRGIDIHQQLVQTGLLAECSNALVTMYAKCGELNTAKTILDMYKSKDVITWTILIAGYAKEGQGQNALDCFEQMQRESTLPNAVTYVCALKACATIKAADKGKQIHDEILRQGFLQNHVALGGALVDMYAKCGAVSKARHVLEELPCRNVISWSAMIAGYTQAGESEQALNCLEQMKSEGILPNAVTYASALKACATIRARNMGKKIHDEIARQGLLQNNVVLGGALVDMYAKCGFVSEARRVLEELPSRNVVTWNALITGYAQQGDAEEALNCFGQMQRDRIQPDAVTYICTLKACAMIRAAERGKQIHNEIVRQQLLQSDIVLGNALVDMYAKCRDVSEAQRVLEELSSRDVVTWNALIAGYTQEGEAVKALNCLEQMQHEGILPNAVTYISALSACTTIRDGDKGKLIHDEIVRQGLLQDNIVLRGALVYMHATCGDMSEARRVLEELQSVDVILWSALIAGYAQEGQAEQALNCFQKMQCKGILPDAVTYVSALKACATARAADTGKQIHDEIVRQGLLQNDIVLGSALVDMYAKCGNVSEAQRVLEELPFRDVVSWNALIAGYAQKGEAEQVLNCFQRMQAEGILPNVVTCACVLNVYCHRGLVEEGQALFVNMSTKYGVKPNVECCTCMIDLFGRAGHLEKAARLVAQMQSSECLAVWHALLGACLRWADVSVGEWAFKGAVKLDKSDGAAYVLMANIYATAGMEEKAKSVESMRISNKAWKKPGCTGWIDTSNTTREFSVRNTTLSHEMSHQKAFKGLNQFSQNIS